MKAIIFAAGKGTRMRPLTDTQPKQMVHILGKPLLKHILESLPDEISELILVNRIFRESDSGLFWRPLRREIHSLSLSGGGTRNC